MKFPVKYIEDNLIINDKDQVWAYFKIEGFSYDFLDFNQKKDPFFKQINLLNNLGLDMHFLSIPHPTDIEGILKDTISEIDFKEFSIKDNGKSFIKQTMEQLLVENERNETSEYYDYIGIQLDPEKNRYVAGNMALELIRKSRVAMEKLELPTYNVSGLNPRTDIMISVIHAYQNQAEIIHSSLNHAFGSGNSRVLKAREFELISIIEKAYSVKNNNSDVKPRRNYKIGEKFSVKDKKGKEHKVVRTSDYDLLELQNTVVNEYQNPKFLELKKINRKSEVEKLYAQYFVISGMTDVNWHPGFEWLHNLKLQLGFPVSVSIRVDVVPNELIKKRLSNVRLEIQDQKSEAMKGGGHADLTVEKSDQGVMQMEQYFQETGHPAFATNFIIKITGEDEHQLKERASTLANNLSRQGIDIVAPYGEQSKLMFETIPGGSKLLEDYKIEVDAGILAGMMFGSSTNIGDNRGFYIGHTLAFNKPVFVQPDLAAKAFEGLGNVVDSISVLVAGMTGKGKSFFMNLFVYLSALTGSRGLIIDPKGDRTGWSEGLPYIPKSEIEVWTLGTEVNDAGSLDPFRTSSNLEEGAELALDILSFLTAVKVEDLGYGLLNNAVMEVVKMDDPCIGEVIEILEGWYDKRPERMSDDIYRALERIVNTLRSLQSQVLSSLLFGRVGQNYKQLDYDKTLQVLMIQNLNLASENATSLLPSQKISEAIMISITAWTKKYMINNERSVHKFILQDEASAVERNETGSQLMDHIVRQGRYWNTTLLKGSQNASDHGRDVANMGMKFSFGLRKEEEAIEMLNYLNLPETEENVRRIVSLGTGECLFQDIYGRSAVIKINPVFKDLLNAFDSSTSTEEERERERQRM